jgi:hypothetical protein
MELFCVSAELFYLSVNLAGCLENFQAHPSSLAWVRQPAWGEC